MLDAVVGSAWAGEAAKLAASLLAVGFAVWLAARLGLGGEARIADAAHAIRLAEAAEAGFRGEQAAVSAGGHAAIVRGPAGEHLLVCAHGGGFAARPIDGAVGVRLDKSRLVVTVGEPGFAAVILELGADAAAWAAGMRRIAARPAAAAAPAAAGG